VLRGRGHRSLPVCAGGRVVGLLDGRTVAERLTAGDLDVRTACVHDLPLPDLICGWEDEDVTEALALMRTQDLAELLVLDREGGVVGWVALDASPLPGRQRVRRTPRHSPPRAASLCDARRGRPRQPVRFLIATGAGLPPQPRALVMGRPRAPRQPPAWAPR